jgi:hypothetical protein
MNALDSYHRIGRLWRTGFILTLCLNTLALGHVQAASASTITVNSKLDTADPGNYRLRWLY